MNIDPEFLFRALSDPTRLRSLMLLELEGELCVCELTYALQIAQPKMSRHLSVLRESGLALDRREGLWIHYKINPDLPQWVGQVLQQTAQGLSASEPFIADRAALKEMPNRPGSRCCA
jgi:ArsR family transcriptional regulator